MPATQVDTIVRGGQVVTASEAYEASIAIQGEKIVAIGPDELLPPADHYIDASGKYILPGAIDCHVHLGGHDDYRTGGIAAAQAGLTTIIPFALYDLAHRETLPQAIKRHNEEVGKVSVVDFAWHFILNNDPYIFEGLPEALRMGVSSYKMFMTYKKRKDRMCSDAFICRAMEIIAAGGGITQLHCENGDVIDYLEDKMMAEGRVHPTDFPQACPEWVEEEAINRAIKLGALTNCPTYVVHLSTQLGLELIKRAQAEGQKVWTESCPQYLLLSDAEMGHWGPLAKIGPPLRPAGGPNQAALWQGLEQGYISCVASDHAPASQELKQPGWKNIFVGPDGAVIPFGSPGLETLVPLTYSEGVVKREFGLSWMARALAENPARIFGLYPRKGTIRVGSDADLLILDPTPRRTIHAAEHVSKTGYTLFEGWEVHGKPWVTLLRGRVLLNQGKLEQQPGYGEFLSAGSPMPPIGGRVK
jgi:dihydropyrimidinase